MDDLDAEAATLIMHGNIARVFSERDAGRRLAAMADLWSPVPSMYEPGETFHGREGISGNIGQLHERLPAGTVFTPRGPAKGHHDLYVLKWAAGVPGQEPHTFGTDIAVFQGGRLHRLYVLLDLDA